MAYCKICGRKESKKRTIKETKVCCECEKKLKQHNYILVNANKDNMTFSPHNSSINDDSCLSDNGDIRDEQLKKLITKCMMQVNQQNSTMINVLEKHIIRLQKEVKELRNERKTNHNDGANDSPFTIPLRNRFNDLPVDDDIIIDENSDENKLVNSKDPDIIANEKEKKVSKNKHEGVYINPYPDRDQLLLNNVLKHTSIGTNSTEAIKKLQKAVIFSDSITRRIDMREFNDLMINGGVVKRAFRGATASQMNYYVHATLSEDKPDIIIIHAGTNNLTKKEQTIQETTKEIIDIAKTCRRAGVQSVYISSLTCRPAYQNEIREINELLKHYANIHEYMFIDNDNIHDNQLWKDEVHLNDTGICTLANNYLYYLNSTSRQPLPFSSIWD